MAAPAIVALIWFGMLVGVSFLATPVKFVVQDLSLATALQVGQITFAFFTKMEWGLAAALVAASAFGWARARRTRPLVLGLALALAASVIAQALWLLPALDARVVAIVAGDAPPPSSHHALYAGLEAAKALMLAVLALVALRRPPPPRSIADDTASPELSDRR